MHPPHVTQDPVPVVATVCRLVSEAWLIALYPCIGVGSGEVPVKTPQLLNETIRP
ncbi:hypothetical protein EGK38_011795 [Enterobacter hormaechei]|nr:hypothetical protein [Enterobacter hormaechei]QXR29753.1 hypothetical protein EGK38_011795 [Enterobacter hormaechei]HBL4918202.1 hypothetical protein [Enterobacter hormaechei]